MGSPDPVMSVRGKLARAYDKRVPADEAKRQALRSELAAAKIEKYIKRVVDEAPPLTAEQRERLASILVGGDAA